MPVPSMLNPRVHDSRTIFPAQVFRIIGRSRNRVYAKWLCKCFKLCSLSGNNPENKRYLLQIPVFALLLDSPLGKISFKPLQQDF